MFRDGMVGGVGGLGEIGRERKWEILRKCMCRSGVTPDLKCTLCMSVCMCASVCDDGGGSWGVREQENLSLHRLLREYGRD